MSDLVTVNVSGTKFQVAKHIFAKLEDSMKGITPVMEEGKPTFFIGRNAACFDSILFYHQCGELHLPPSVCPSVFNCELKFWNIKPAKLETCCNYKYSSFLSEQADLAEFQQHSKTWSRNLIETENNQITGIWSAFRQWMKIMMYDPFSCISGKVYLGIFTTVVVASIALLCFVTLDVAYEKLPIEEMKTSELLPYIEEEVPVEFLSHPDDLNRTAFFEFIAENNPNIEVKKPYVEILEHIITGVFTLDLFIRVLICNSIKAFCFDFLNIFDLISVACNYIKIIIKGILSNQRLQHSIVDRLDFLNTLRLLRLIRILCLQRDFLVLLYSLKASLKSLGLLFCMLCTCVVFFSCAIYFFEEFETIPDIPFAFWWAIVTMTTVGYGDVVPKTLGGKIVGAMCSLIGVMVVAVTLPVVVNNFTLFSNYTKAIANTREEKNKYASLKKKKSKICDFPGNKRFQLEFTKTPHK